MLRFFLLLTFSGKTNQKFAREVFKLAFQKCGRRRYKSAVGPIVLSVEIHKPKNYKLKFYRSFLQIVVEIGEKYALNPLFNILEAQLASKNRKLKSAVVDPPLCYPLVVNVIFKLRFFLDFYAYCHKNALNIPICALFYRLAVKLTA